MRFAMRKGSSAVAKATKVKSGTRKKTSDLLIGCFMAFKEASRKPKWREQECREQQSVIRKNFSCQWGAEMAKSEICDIVRQRQPRGRPPQRRPACQGKGRAILAGSHGL
jgi:hypothetical protein